VEDPRESVNSKPPSVCAIVVTYNRKEMVRDCLNALRAQTRPLDKIIVVDNCSTDGTAKMLAKEFPETQIETLAANIGGAGGFHHGIRSAHEEGYDWLWVMDDDTAAAPDALEQLLAARSPEAGALACLIRDLRGCINAGHHKLVYGPLMLIRKPKELEPSWNDDLPAILPLDANAFLGIMFPRTVVGQIGLPEADFFIYNDDTEYTYRVSRRWPIHLVTGAVIIDRQGSLLDIGANATMAHPSPWRQYYGLRNAIRFRLRYSLFAGVAYGIASYTKQFIEALSGVDGFAARRLAYLTRGLIDGMLERGGQRVLP